MKKHKKILFLGIMLIVLTGCTNYIDPQTKQVMPEYIISWGDAWIWGTEGWFASLIVWPLAQLLNLFAQYTGAFLSIVIVTILIRLLTLRSSIKSSIQQQKMQLIAPEQARIEEKYRGRDDQQSKMAKATEIQKLFQKHDINPMGAIGGQFLQLPIIFGMYQAVTRADMITNGSILGQTFEITPMQGMQQGNVVVILIFISMIIAQAASMFLPNYLTKRKMIKRPGQKSPANQAQTMMIGSLLMVVFFALNWNIGMSLYWMISALGMLGQTLFINHKYGQK